MVQREVGEREALGEIPWFALKIPPPSSRPLDLIITNSMQQPIAIQKYFDIIQSYGLQTKPPQEIINYKQALFAAEIIRDEITISSETKKRI